MSSERTDIVRSDLPEKSIRTGKALPSPKAEERSAVKRRGRPPSLRRREQIADAAIEVLANQGTRGLNHRAIDRLLNLPDGSTSHYYPRRIDLINATVRRMTETHMSDMKKEYAPILQNLADIDAEELTEHVVSLLFKRLRAPARARTIAYFELSIDGIRHPEYRRILQVEARAFWKMWESIFAYLGARDPKNAARAYASFQLGQLYMYAVRPDIRLKKSETFEIFHTFMRSLLK